MTQEGPVIPGRRSLRPLAGVLAAIAASVTGTRISLIALPWFVLVTTGSATRTGLVAFFEMAPYVLVKALSGPLVDRTGPRTVSWTTDLASAAAAASIPLLHTLDLLSFPVLLGLVALIGAARGPGDLAKEVMVPEAAERAGTPLEQAMGLSGVVERLASTIGPAAGGALVALLGPMTGLVVNAGCFVLGSVIVAVALPRGTGRPAVDPSASADAQEPGYWRRFGEGFTFLRGDPLLLAVIVVVGITNLLAGAPRFLVLALDAPLGVVLAVFAVSGFAAGFINPVLGAVLVERVPRRMLGRVNALGDSLAWSGIPLGGLLAGAAVTAAGLTPVLLVCGAAYFLTTTLAGLRPEWRAMDRPRGNGAQREEAARDGARPVS
ncbi:MFS transporter [Streptomyces sp. CB02613]|uniref:MFS transporter n=1 Tax=Streptomyces sp. CB02613 TaxID=2020328 RepID=UPI000C2758B0|nr:MFS transporter [Streptomyces sp. CB02613]PJN24343.1 MFS transporter [Streptomyces sp. CB02613]